MRTNKKVIFLISLVFVLQISWCSLIFPDAAKIMARVAKGLTVSMPLFMPGISVAIINDALLVSVEPMHRGSFFYTQLIKPLNNFLNGDFFSNLAQPYRDMHRPDRWSRNQRDVRLSFIRRMQEVFRKTEQRGEGEQKDTQAPSDRRSKLEEPTLKTPLEDKEIRKGEIAGEPEDIKSPEKPDKPGFAEAKKPDLKEVGKQGSGEIEEIKPGEIIVKEDYAWIFFLGINDMLIIEEDGLGKKKAKISSSNGGGSEALSSSVKVGNMQREIISTSVSSASSSSSSTSTSSSSSGSGPNSDTSGSK